MKSYLAQSKLIVGVLVGAFVGVVAGNIATSFADNNRATSNILDNGVVVPYDGYLMLDSAPVNAQGQELEFALYESASGGTAQWVERQAVNVVNGRFSVALGKGTKLSASPANATFSDVILDAQRLYIGIKVKDAGGQFIELAGRQAIEAAPFAAWSARSADFKVEGVLQPQNGIVMRDDTSISGVDQIIGYNDLKLSGSPTSGGSNLFIGNDGNVSIARSLSVGGNTTMTGPATVTDTLNVGSSITTSALNASKFDGAYIPTYRNWGSQGAGAGGAAIYNDGNVYKALMLVGNNSDGGTRRHVRVFDDLMSNNDMYVGGTDLHLGTNATGRGDGGRAMIQSPGDTLVLNYNGDFAGGVRVDGNMTGGFKYTVEYTQSSNGTQTLITSSQGMCFLTEMYFDHAWEDVYPMGCRVHISGSNWVLQNTEATGGAHPNRGDVTCRARCLLGPVAQ